MSTRTGRPAATSVSSARSGKRFPMSLGRLLPFLAPAPLVGGQAVMEGVMMRNGDVYALAVRTADGNISVENRPWFSLPRSELLKKPFLRGFPTLIETLVNGIKALNLSAERSTEGTGEELKDWQLVLTLIVSLLFAVGLFVVVVIAMILGKQSTMAYYGIGVEPWGIMFGMIIANTIGTPQWMKPALQVEYFIKTGLVLLGAEILFDKIIAIGTAGIFVAWVVTPIVLITTFIFGQKVLKMASPTLNITISADMSVCGTSAAIAAAAACRAKKEELTLALGLSMTFTAIMMVALPAFIKYLGLPEVLGGAWIGGTVDSTGAVAAAGALLGPKAMYVAATIKMIQNVLIGVTAFGIAVYWCTSVEKTAGRETSLMEIWHRFPKFVIGFLTASIIFSIYSADLGPDLGTALINKGVIDGIEKGVRTWFFVLAFTAIGLSTNFRELAPYFKGGKPLILYVCGQSFNLALTLLMAYVMFYLVFPEITAKI